MKYAQLRSRSMKSILINKCILNALNSIIMLAGTKRDEGGRREVIKGSIAVEFLVRDERGIF